LCPAAILQISLSVALPASGCAEMGMLPTPLLN
jgi:hypothetical protein